MEVGIALKGITEVESGTTEHAVGITGAGEPPVIVHAVHGGVTIFAGKRRIGAGIAGTGRRREGTGNLIGIVRRGTSRLVVALRSVISRKGVSATTLDDPRRTNVKRAVRIDSPAVAHMRHTGGGRGD